MYKEKGTNQGTQEKHTHKTKEVKISRKLSIAVLNKIRSHKETIEQAIVAKNVTDPNNSSKFEFMRIEQVGDELVVHHKIIRSKMNPSAKITKKSSQNIQIK